MNIPRIVALLSSAAALAHAAEISPLPYAVETVVSPKLQMVEPSQVRIDGWLGARIDANVVHRLLIVDTEPLLAGYHKRPGDQPWIGEHVGKWIHAATLAWAYSADPKLKAKLDSVVAELIATQEPDGYLGTYVASKRFGLYDGADWDVWCHKYNLMGLLTYYRYTGNPQALAACRRMGDLLIATFPAKRSILAAGTHMGMAATSVLDPMVLLYRATDDPRYLEFARYIVRAYEEPGGPDIVRTLLRPESGVDRVANGKAYEMMSNLVGIVDLYGVTGDGRLLAAAEHAWDDIVQNRLYITGSVSSRECFSSDHDLPNGELAHVGETCATVTWMQLNAALLAQTGQSRYADEIERSLYNHLAAAQNPSGDDWCYYTALEGVKHYDSGITCCHSSGPRGMALAPTFAYMQSADAVYVSTLETSHARLRIDGHDIGIEQQSGFPRSGVSLLTLRNPEGAVFGIKIRVPGWAAPMSAGDTSSGRGWLSLPKQKWEDGGSVELHYNLSSRVVLGDYQNLAHVAYAWGPFVLALDEGRNPTYAGMEGPQYIRAFDGRAPALASDEKGLSLTTAVRGEWDTDAHPVTLVPFADAGATGKPYAVWLRAP